MHLPSPQWLAKLMDYPHLAQQMADAREFHQKAGWYFTLVNLQRAGEGPPERLDTRRHRH
jgi:hypothetical protein